MTGVTWRTRPTDLPVLVPAGEGDQRHWATPDGKWEAWPLRRPSGRVYAFALYSTDLDFQYAEGSLRECAAEVAQVVFA